MLAKLSKADAVSFGCRFHHFCLMIIFEIIVFPRVGFAHIHIESKSRQPFLTEGPGIYLAGNAHPDIFLF